MRAKTMHFDHERIPERVVPDLTMAAPFQDPAEQIPTSW
jgi:catalase